MWILTRAINDYNQDGDYFVAGWTNKPTAEQLAPLLSTNSVEHVLSGGGREKYEHCWYYLTEIQEGEEYVQNG